MIKATKKGKRPVLKKEDDNTPNHLQRQRIVGELEQSVNAVIADFQTSPTTFNDVSLAHTRRLVESIETVLRHKLLVEPRTGKSQSDPGIIFVGTDDMGLPVERSDMFFRFLDTVVEMAHTQQEGNWSRVVDCRRVALEAEIPQPLAELGWGQGRLLLMELLNCGELGRVAKAAGSPEFRRVLWEHYGDEGVLMQTSYRTKALRLLEGLGGVPVRARHWAPLLYTPLERGTQVAVGKGSKKPPPAPTYSILGTLIEKEVGKYVEKKKSRKSVAPAGRNSSLTSTVSFDEDLDLDGDDLEDGWEGGARDERSAVFSLEELAADGDFDDNGGVGLQVNGGRSDKQIVEGLLSHYGAEQAQQFILHNVDFGEPITVKKQQPFEKEVLTVDGGGVAWEFQAVSSDIDFSAVTRTGQVVRVLERFAEGEKSGGTYVPSGMVAVVLKFNCDFARLRARKILLKTAPVSSGKLHNARIAELASRITASWKVVGAVAHADALKAEADPSNVPAFQTDRDSESGFSLVEEGDAKKKPTKRGSTLAVSALGLVGIKNKLDQEAMDSGCGLCRKPFSKILNRPHSCKSCHHHFCQNCAALRIPLEGPGSKERRVCMRCYVRITDEEWEAKMAEAGASTDHEPGAGPTPYELMVADEAYSKYFKMLKMGVLRQAVAIKMTNDDIPAHLVELFASEGKSSPGAGWKGPSKKGGDGKSEADGGKGGRKSNQPQLRQVHWDALDETKATKSIFGATSSLGQLVPAYVRVDEQLRLLELFGTAEQVAAAMRAKKGKGKGGGTTKGLVSIIDGRRVNNVSIMLKQFAKVFPPAGTVALKDDPTYGKYFKMLKMHLPEPAVRAKMRAEGVDDSILDQSPDDPAPRSGNEEPFHVQILPAVLRLDPQLTVERLAALNEMWPLEVEQKRLAGFRGKVEQFEAEGERWMYAVSKCGVPRSNAKVEAALCSASFEDKLNVLLDDVAALSDTAVLLMGSDRLRRIFEHLLAIGNALNQGARGEIANAKGFTIDSLLKLSETKSTSIKGTTVLTFFVNMVVNRGEVDLLLFPQEIPGLGEAARRSDSMVVNGDVRSLALELRKVETEVRLANEDAAELARRKKEAEDEAKAKEEARKKAAAEAKAKKEAEAAARAKAEAEAAAVRLKAKLARSEAIERLAMDAEDEPKKHRGKAIQDALNARTGLVDKSEVPMQLRPFLNADEDPFIGIKRLHDEWGGGDGESPLLRSLLKLAVIWLSDYEDSLMGEDMIVNRNRASAVNMKSDDGVMLTGICLKQGRHKSSPFYKRHVALGDSGILTYHSLPNLELKGTVSLQNCVVKPNGRRFFLTCKDNMLKDKTKGDRTFVFQPVGDPDVSAWCKAIEALRDRLASVAEEEELNASQIMRDRSIRKTGNASGKSTAVSIFGEVQPEGLEGPPLPTAAAMGHPVPEDSNESGSGGGGDANPRSALLAALNNPNKADNPRGALLADLSAPKKRKSTLPAAGGGRSDLLAAIANRGGRAGKGGAGAGDSDEVDAGPMVEERAVFQQHMVKFVNEAKPKLEHLEGKASEMTKRSKALCSYFGEGSGGSTAHMFQTIQKFCSALTRATNEYEKRNGSLHLNGFDEEDEDESAPKKATWRGANTGPTPAQQAWAALLLSVGVGHVVATYLGPGVVEAVRAADAMVIVRLDPPPFPICYGNEEAVARHNEKYKKLAEVSTSITRAFVSVASVVTLGNEVFTPFGPGAVRGRAEVPKGSKLTSQSDGMKKKKKRKEDRDTTVDGEEEEDEEEEEEEDGVEEGEDDEALLKVPKDSLSEVAPRYTVELSWGKVYICPKDVKTNKEQVPPYARVGHRVLTIADMQEQARVKKQEELEALLRQKEDEAEAERKAKAEAARYVDDGREVVLAEGESDEEDEKGLTEEDIAEQIAQFDELREMGMLNDEEYEEAVSALRPQQTNSPLPSDLSEKLPEPEVGSKLEDRSANTAEFEDEAALEFERALAEQSTTVPVQQPSANLDDSDEDFGENMRESEVGGPMSPGDLDDSDEDFGENMRESEVGGPMSPGDLDDSDEDFGENMRESEFGGPMVDGDSDSDYEEERTSISHHDSASKSRSKRATSMLYSIFEANPYQPLGIIFDPRNPKSLVVSAVDPLCQAYSAGMRDGSEIGLIGRDRIFTVSEFSTHWKSFQDSGEPCIIAFKPPMGQQPEIVCSSCTYHNPSANTECIMCGRDLLTVDEAVASQTQPNRLAELKKQNAACEETDF